MRTKNCKDSKTAGNAIITRRTAMRSARKVLFLVAVFLAAMPSAFAIGAAAPKDATPVTKNANTAVLKELNFADQEDFEEAQRGLVAPPANTIIKDGDGKEVWNLNAYDFLKQKNAPATVNPSLWRQAQVNMSAGLFRVVDRIYQVRGLDVSNMTIVEGDTGAIVIDPLVSVETARAALELYFQRRGKRPVVAVIYTHSHVDHFGGVKGVIDETDVKAGKVKILAPERFLEAAVSENMTAGIAMSRRSDYCCREASGAKLMSG